MTLPQGIETTGAGTDSSRRLFVYNGGFLTQKRVRRMLQLSGYKIRLGIPGPQDLVAVWGKGPTAHRGEAIAARHDCALLRVEDAFLRSLHPGRGGEAPIGLQLDRRGVHFDPSTPSDLEHLLSTHPLDDSALMARARDAIARLKAAHLTKYSGFDLGLPCPDPGYVLVVDQTLGDASVTASGATRDTFLEMLVFAQQEHPGARIVIKTHPETRAGYRAGHFRDEDTNDRISLFDDPVSPWQLFDGAVAVYTVSSQMGFEAIFAGHNPRVFGQPFYAGWGLTQDQSPLDRRTRRLSRTQLFAAAMILYPVWYDPWRDRLGQLEDAIDAMETATRAWREDHRGWVATGMRLWKRKPLSRVFGGQRSMIFEDNPNKAAKKAEQTGRRQMIWASKAGTARTGIYRVEDGFLRSKGLGAELIPPLSLVCDDLGIYYDPNQPSRLEQLIAASTNLREDQLRRAEQLRAALIRNRITKYNLGGALPELPRGHRILVPGQVADDASVLTGAGLVSDNLSLLQETRAANPDAVILYKPHPDVEAGLRTGRIDRQEALKLADFVLDEADPAALLDKVDAVWTMTSLLGFEALLRGVKVTTLGVPFYAGWGLTDDRAPTPPRRNVRVSLDGLCHATLIDYPRYFDPVSGLSCTAELIVERLDQGHLPHPGPVNRTLSKLQGLFAGYTHLWR